MWLPWRHAEGRQVPAWAEPSVEEASPRITSTVEGSTWSPIVPSSTCPELVAYLAGLLAAERRARGIRAGSRALSCWRRGALRVIPDYATAPACTMTDRDQPAPHGQ